MKKIIGIVILALALNMTGCKSNDTKKVDTDASKTAVQDKSKDRQDIDNSIQQLSKLVDEKKYDEAKSVMQELNRKGLDENQKASIDKLKSRIDSESSKAEGNKSEEKQDTKQQGSMNQENKRQEYKAKLDAIAIDLKKLDIKDAGTTADMRQAANERYKRWDAALNEIYGVLKGQLSSSDMKKLQNEEVQWISDRDAKAKKASSEFKGGTIEPVVYGNSLAETTKQRCYELVEKYMK